MSSKRRLNVFINKNNLGNQIDDRFQVNFESRTSYIEIWPEIDPVPVGLRQILSRI